MQILSNDYSNVDCQHNITNENNSYVNNIGASEFRV